MKVNFNDNTSEFAALQQMLARKALDRPRCSFEIDFMLGYSAELPFLESVWICARLEAFWAAEVLANDDDPQEALDSITYMLQWAEHLTAAKHPSVRFEAAFLRADALRVLQKTVHSPRIGKGHLEKTYALLQRQLAAWPSDANAWIGDRALTMHAYESIRVGAIAGLLTAEETTQFEEEGILKDFYSFTLGGVPAFHDGNLTVDASDDAVGAILSRSALAYAESIEYAGREWEFYSLSSALLFHAREAARPLPRKPHRRNRRLS